mmetsp:Transcript_78211/g.209120  ORF Transcript_78211/g.209120 Transcript_78211/m.209120 type:complete len:220 (-) Transcript_78211:136-795(-)
MHPNIPDRHTAVVQPHYHRALHPRLQALPRKPLQLQGRLPRPLREPQVHLRHLHSRRRPSVLHLELHLGRRRRQGAVLHGGIGQPVAEGVRGLHPGAGVPPIPHVQTLGVGGGPENAEAPDPGPLRLGEVHLIFHVREGEGQAPTGTHRPSQNVGHGLPVLLPGHKGRNHRLHRLPPGCEHRTGADNHHHRVGLLRSHGGDQVLVLLRQRQGAPVRPLR